MKDAKARNPVFFDLFRQLEQGILDGKYKKGDLLPSEIDLAKEFSVSRYSAREAYSELVRRQFIKRVRRKGTIVVYDPAAMRLKKVGLILIDDVPAFYLFVKGVQDVLGVRGAGLFVQYNYSEEWRHAEALQNASAHDVEGLIITPPDMTSREPYRKMMAEGFPIVVALQSYPGVHSVFPDDHKAGRLIGEHFGEQGFKRPAALVMESPFARERLYGFREGIARFGLELKDEYVLPVQYLDEKGVLLPDIGRREVEQLLALRPRPDAIFGFNDSIAISVYYWLLKHGVRVPQDVALAGVDSLGNKFHPFSLTTVDTGLDAMGRAAAELLLRQIEHPHLEPVHQKIEPRLIVAGSTAT